MEIIIEYVILENFLISLLILKTTALLSKEKGRLFCISALISGGVTVVLPLLYITPWGSVLFQIGLTTIFLCISFKFKTFKKFLQLFVCYFVSNLIYGGACFFFEQLFGITSVLIVLSICVFTYILIKFVMKSTL